MKKIIIALIFIIFISVSCNKDENTEYTGFIPDELRTLDGVTLKTELEYYAEGTARILAFWENNTAYNIMYGEDWQLEKYNEKNDKWTIAHDGNGVIFNAIGITLLPEWYRRHIYSVSIFAENITEGRYRIKTDFFNDDIDGSVEERRFGVTAEFTITSDKSLLKKSELDFVDFENSREIIIGYECHDNSKIFKKEMDFPVHVYKNEKTYDTTIVINGDEYYKIAEGNGKWGVVTCCFYIADDNKKFLIYSYSREIDGKKQSYIGIFDLIERKEVYCSDAYETYDIWVAYRRGREESEYAEKDIFVAGFMEHEEFENGGYRQSSAPGEIGYFKYESGVFHFYRNE